MTLNRIALAGLLLAVAACMTVRPVQPAQFIPLHNPAVVWVTYTDNSFVPVAGPKIVGDSLKGTWAGLGEPVAMSLSEIKTVQAKIKSPKRTILLFTVVGAAVAGAVYTLETAGTGGLVFNGINECGFYKGVPIPTC
jgi:hypothetical protein